MLSIIVAIALCGNGAVSPAKPLKKLPHIIMHLADDYGWANAGWHRPEGFAELLHIAESLLLYLLIFIILCTRLPLDIKKSRHPR